MRLCRLVFFVLFELVVSATSIFAIAAFPGATGFGSQTVGGRGGQVLHVTSLSDSGAGSLREALESKSGPRIVVFDVAGHILLNIPITIKNPFVTIAGQTAPGTGVLLRKEGLIIATHDVIVRGLRVRVGDENGLTNSRDGIDMTTSYSNTDVYNIILDHNSVSWAIDENVSTWISSSKPYKVHDITVSWTIISEGLNDSVHVDEGAAAGVTDPHSMGVLFGPTGASNLTLHHNLLAQNRGRNPRIDGVSKAEILNNVIYGYGDVSTEIGSAATTLHLIGNYYKNNSTSSEREVLISANPSTGTKMYIESNYMDAYRNRYLDADKIRHPLNDEHAIILRQASSDIKSFYTATPPIYRSLTEIFSPTTVATNPDVAYTQVLEGSGAFPRDSVDSRVITDVKNRTGNIIDSQSQVGGWPTLEGTKSPDGDNDGIPDYFESSKNSNLEPNGLAPSGYTWIEEYINSKIISNTQNLDKPGDFNSDGKVNIYDFVKFLNGYGTTYDQDDFVILITNYGT